MILQMRTWVLRLSYPTMAGLLVGVVAAMSASRYPLRPNTDDIRYLGLAFNFAHGAGLTLPGQSAPTSWFYPPGWPLLLAWPFVAGLSVTQVALLSSLGGSACLGASAALWSRIFAKRLGPLWGTLAGAWPLLSYPALAVAPSAASEGFATLAVALLATWLDSKPVVKCGSKSGALVLGASLSSLALLRTALIFLWPGILWDARRRLSRNVCILGAVLATIIILGVRSLTTPEAQVPGSYGGFAVRAWSENPAGVFEGILLPNWGNIGSLFSDFLLSPLPFSRRVVQTVDPWIISILGLGIGVALVIVAVRAHRSGTDLPPLIIGPALLAVPFLFGYPYRLEPRFLIPGCAALGFLAATSIKGLSAHRSSLRATVLCAWLATSVIWWCRLARGKAEEQRKMLADASSILLALETRGPPSRRLCTREPEILWVIDPESTTCRLLLPMDEITSKDAPQERQMELIGQALDRNKPTCVMDRVRPAGQPGTSYAPWGYQVQIENSNWVAWCR